MIGQRLSKVVQRLQLVPSNLTLICCSSHSYLMRMRMIQAASWPEPPKEMIGDRLSIEYSVQTERELNTYNPNTRLSQIQPRPQSLVLVSNCYPLQPHPFTHAPPSIPHTPSNSSRTSRSCTSKPPFPSRPHPLPQPFLCTQLSSLNSSTSRLSSILDRRLLQGDNMRCTFETKMMRSSRRRRSGRCRGCQSTSRGGRRLARRG